MQALDRGSAHPRTRPALLAVGVFAASVYGGYFGAAMGVMLLAIIGLALPLSLAHTSGLRSVLSIIVNGVAAVVFLIHGGLAWEAVGLLAIGSLFGGYLGARLALALPAPVLRVVVVLIGRGHRRTAPGLRRRISRRPTGTCPTTATLERPGTPRRASTASRGSTGTRRTRVPGAH